MGRTHHPAQSHPAHSLAQSGTAQRGAKSHCLETQVWEEITSSVHVADVAVWEVGACAKGLIQAGQELAWISSYSGLSIQVLTKPLALSKYNPAWSVWEHTEPEGGKNACNRSQNAKCFSERWTWTDMLEHRVGGGIFTVSLFPRQHQNFKALFISG